MGFWDPDLLKVIRFLHLLLDKIDDEFRQLSVLALVVLVVVGFTRLVEFANNPKYFLVGNDHLVGCLGNALKWLHNAWLGQRWRLRICSLYRRCWLF